jgi:hypothetical protein
MVAGPIRVASFSSLAKLLFKHKAEAGESSRKRPAAGLASTHGCGTRG